MGTSPNRLCTENLYSEDYTRTTSSENHNKNPPSKNGDKIILCENYTDVEKKTGEKVKLTMAATPGIQLDELAKP